MGAIDLSTQEPGVCPEAPEGLLQVDVSGYFHGDTRKMAMRDAAVFTLDDLVAEDAAMKRVRDYIPVAASCDLPVMIYGETGTGKEVVAQAIHNASDAAPSPSLPRTAPPCRRTCWRASCSATRRGPSPAPEGGQAGAV